MRHASNLGLHGEEGVDGVDVFMTAPLAFVAVEGGETVLTQNPDGVKDNAKTSFGQYNPLDRSSFHFVAWR
jgi:hypothetical protein